MKPAKLSLEKREIINALLVGSNVTVDELFHSFELPAAHQCGGLDRRYLNISEASACVPFRASRFIAGRRKIGSDSVSYPMPEAVVF